MSGSGCAVLRLSARAGDEEREWNEASSCIQETHPLKEDKAEHTRLGWVRDLALLLVRERFLGTVFGTADCHLIIVVVMAGGSGQSRAGRLAQLGDHLGAPARAAGEQEQHRRPSLDGLEGQRWQVRRQD